MFDDRKDPSAGVKFKDAELIGIPYIVIVGKALADGKLELRFRKSGEKSEITAATAADEIYRVITSA
jgi:prolyl-tRNA synthetase